jgi:VIT1/CCC1 family predicted Fe2+/Mn2+ transporter
MFDKLKSRKFWFAFLGALLPVVAQYFTDEVQAGQALQMSALVVISYIFGQGYVDAKAIEKK